MGLLTQDELNPLQAARRVAEEHIEAIRSIAIARSKTLPVINAHNLTGPAMDEHERYQHIADVVSALQTIYDAVSELEFEEEQPAEPVEPEPEDAEPEEDEDDEDMDDDDDGDED
jgi:hypothetical protein